MRGAVEVGKLIAAGVIPVLAYLVVGLLVTRRLRPDAPGAEGLALAFVFGTGFSSLAVLVLRMLDVPIPLWTLAAVFAAGAAWLLRSPRSRAPGFEAHKPTAPRWARAVDGASLVLGVLTVAAALGPETFWDGFEYHLPIIRAWSEGPIRALPGVLDAELRAGVDLLYVPAVASGHPDAAAAVSAGFALSLAALIRGEATRRATPGAGALAGFFALVVPFTLDNAASSYVDLGVGAYGFLALLFADRWNRSGDARGLGACALCLAFAANAKLHAAVLIPACLMIVTLGGRRPGWRLLLRCAAIVAALGLPWLVKAGITTGNPFFPFLGDWLGYGNTDPTHLSLRRFRLSTSYWEPRGPLSFLHYLASLTFGRNPHYSGLIGALPLALLPAALQRTSRPTAVLIATLAPLLLLQFHFMPALRFGSPLLPFVAVATAVGGARLACSGRAASRTLTAVLALLAVHHVATMGQRYLPRLPALTAPEAYQRAVFPDQMALGELVARGHGVVAIPKGAVLWMPRPVYVLNWERNGELFFDRVLGHRTPPAEARSLLVERGVGSLVLEVPSPLPTGGGIGHPTVDAWIAGGLAELRGEPEPLQARPDRVWVLVDLR